MGLLFVGPALSSLRIRSKPGCSHNYTRNMLEINCSTLQFCAHSFNVKKVHASILYCKHTKLVRRGLYWVIKGPHVMRF